MYGTYFNNVDKNFRVEGISVPKGPRDELTEAVVAALCAGPAWIPRFSAVAAEAPGQKDRKYSSALAPLFI